MTALLLLLLATAHADDDTASDGEAAPEGTTTEEPAEASPAEPAEKERPSVSVSFNIDTEIRLQRYDPTPQVHVGGSKPRFVEEVTRIVGRANRGRWSFDLQVDQLAFIGLPHIVDGERKTVTPAMQSSCDDGAPENCLTNPFREWSNDRLYVNPEKIGATYRGEDFKITFGDFYASLGVGAVMNINRNVDNDVDTSIQGLRVIAQPGDWKITAMAGMLNRQQVFQDQQNPGLLDGDRRHIVAAARVERYNIGATTLGAHAAMYNYVDNSRDDSLEKGLQGPINALGQPPDAIIGGATMATSLGGVDLNLEADGISFAQDALHPAIYDLANEELQPGYALYGSGLWFTGPVTWQLEVRRFKNVYRLNNPIPVQFGYTIVAPPTLELERAINPNTAAVTGSNDLTGGLLRADMMIGDAVPYLAIGVTRDADLVNAAQKAPEPETILQTQFGAEIIAAHWSLNIDGMARADLRDGEYGPDGQVYAATDIKAPLPLGLAGTQISLVGNHFWQGPTQSVPEAGTWHEFNTSVSVLIWPNFGITGFYDNTTNPIAGEGGNLREEWPHAYGAGELFWKPSSAWTVKAFHGGYAAGIRCSGGQCRNVPAFTGSRLAVVGTFQ